ARVGAFQHAGAKPEVAHFERDMLRSLLFLPQRLALELEQLDRARIRDHALVLLDFFLGVLRRRAGAGARECRRRDPPREAHASEVSVLFRSPLLSSQLISSLSPA